MRKLTASELSEAPDMSPEARIFQAVKNGDLDFVGATPTTEECEKIEECIQSVEAKHFGTLLDTAAFAAAYFNKLKLLGFLIEHLANKTIASDGATQAENHFLAAILNILNNAKEPSTAYQNSQALTATYNPESNLTNHLLHDAADVDCVLIGAVAAGNTGLVDALIIKKKADKNWAVLGAACHNQQTLMEHLLKRHHADISCAASGAAQVGNQALVDSLIARGADKNKAAAHAAYHNQLTLLERLLSTHAADINSAISGAEQANNVELSQDLKRRQLALQTPPTKRRAPQQLFQELPTPPQAVVMGLQQHLNTTNP